MGVKTEGGRNGETPGAPDFSPNFTKPGGTWGSIGSGAKHDWAPHYADNNAFMTVFAHGEVMNPGGSAAMVAHSVAHSLEQEPMDSVSPIIQVGIVRAADHEIKILRRQHQGAWTIAQYGPSVDSHPRNSRPARCASSPETQRASRARS